MHECVVIDMYNIIIPAAFIIIELVDSIILF